MMRCIQLCLQKISSPLNPLELQLKSEHSGAHATFLNLDINVKDRVFVYNILIRVMLLIFYPSYALH